MASISRLHLVTIGQGVAFLAVLHAHLAVRQKNPSHFVQDSHRICNAIFQQRYERWASIVCRQLHSSTIRSWNRKQLYLWYHDGRVTKSDSKPSGTISWSSW